MLHVAGKAARHESRALRHRHAHGVHRLLHHAARRARRLHELVGGGRGLAGGEAVDLVVVEDGHHVDVAAHRVDEVVAADAVAVTVAHLHDHPELGVGERDAGRERERPAVEAVEALRPIEVGAVAVAADAPDHHVVLKAHAAFGEHLGKRLLHVEVAATGAPRGRQRAGDLGDLRHSRPPPSASRRPSRVRTAAHRSGGVSLPRRAGTVRERAPAAAR